MWRFKEGDKVITNYQGLTGHASGISNGTVFTLREKYTTWSGECGWWDANRQFYWLEDWLLLVGKVERPKSGFGKFIQKVETDAKHL